MDLINTVLFGKKFGICAFCGRKTELSDAVFHKENVAICSDCNKFIKIAPFDLLYKGTDNVSFIIAPMYYSGIIRDAIHNLKFNCMPGIAYALGYYINNYLTVFEQNEDTLFSNFDVLVPVPLSATRKNDRGYNQAELIANEISEFFNIRVDTKSLVKKKNTKPQSSLSHEERKYNLNHAYSCTDALSGKRVLLVDDVCTTGNTLDFCAKALLEKGVKSVGAITVTHSSSQRHSIIYNDIFA